MPVRREFKKEDKKWVNKFTLVGEPDPHPEVGEALLVMRSGSGC